MASLNKILLIGNMVADPELKQTQSGIAVVTFTIAVNRRFAKQGEQSSVDFIRITAWRQQAEFVARYFKKGKPIFVLGSLQNRNWTDQNGQKHYEYEVVADEVSFVESKSSDESAQGSGFGGGSDNGGYVAPSYASPSDAVAGFEDLANDDDLPF